jgi:beta-barrel assembly-enhancing protease
MNIKRFLMIASVVLLTGGLYQCNSKKDGGGINIFSLEDDKKFGAQTAEQIASDPASYPVLDPIKYPKAYEHIQRITNNVLNSGKLNHRNDFVWQVKIIQNDSTLNAFCTPGGYIYVYTGIIKYLDTEDQLAGVMGHEIAHADLRHSTDAMTQQYGLSMMFDIVLGKQSTLSTIGQQLINLKYSRSHESQADEYSVIYLSGTPYQCNGAAGFFEKLSSGGASTTPVFLSTHPGDASRIQNINAKSTSISCSTTPIGGTTYQDFKNSLP